jgi:hypothetical protein
MGEVLMFTPRSHSQTAPTKPLKSDNLAYPSDKDMAEAKLVVDALSLESALHGGPEDDGA